MEGGVGIFVLLVILVIAIGFGIALYVTGGALFMSKDKGEGPPPRGKTDPIDENTTAMRPPSEREHEHSGQSRP